MLCPLCGRRKARRACPALGHQICAVCCGTKRLVEIRCPPDCGYLAAAREHPPATLVRQHQRDSTLVAQLVRDLNERQSRLFLLVGVAVVQYEPAELHPLADDDVRDAAAALARTFETASRGVIYELRAVSGSGARLAATLKPVLAELGQGGGTAFDRDAALVLHRLEDGVAQAQASDPANRRAFVELLGRVLAKGGRDAAGEPASREPPRVILP